MKKLYTLLFTSIVCFSGCDSEDPFILMSLEDEKQLGLQVKEQIEADPVTYPVLDRIEYADAYAYIESMKNEILASNEVRYRDTFAWELSIIHDDETLNAFATPGGYIYVYTGLIKFLQQADDLAGVMGHEIAHADRRHSANQLQKNYGIAIISSILLGDNPNQVAEIAAQLAGSLAGLSFSRSDEADADNFSVEYLADGNYACNGAASFFQKLLDNNQAPGIPEFLSTHPDPENRVEDINTKAIEIGCSTSPSNESTPSYDDFKAMLPS